MLRDEYQELSLAVTNLSAQERTLNVHLSGGGGFSAEKLTLRAGYWIPPSTKRSSKTRGEALPVWTDDALPRLADDRLLTLKPAQTRRLWLTVNSNGVNAGDYQFSLKIASKSSRMTAEIPIRTETTLFKLDEANEALWLIKESRISGAGVLEIPHED